MGGICTATVLVSVSRQCGRNPVVQKYYLILRLGRARWGPFKKMGCPANLTTLGLIS